MIGRPTLYNSWLVIKVTIVVYQNAFSIAVSQVEKVEHKIKHVLDPTGKNVSNKLYYSFRIWTRCSFQNVCRSELLPLELFDARTQLQRSKLFILPSTVSPLISYLYDVI